MSFIESSSDNEDTKLGRVENKFNLRIGCGE